MQALALKNATINEVKNAQTAKDLRAKGINIYEWSPEDLAQYRAAVKAGWTEFATTPEAKALLKSHIEFLTESRRDEVIEASIALQACDGRADSGPAVVICQANFECLVDNENRQDHQPRPPVRPS